MRRTTGVARVCFGVVSTLAVLAMTVSSNAADAAPRRAKASVMIVGIAHFVSRRDVHNSTFGDSPLSPKRQLQIADVVRHLARFHPTKVLIEAAMTDPAYVRRYARYVRGAYALPADEIYQFGFKLAKRSGNRTVYPIDTFGPTLLNDDSRIDAFLKAHFSRIDDPSFDAFEARDDALERSGTYLDVLRDLNTDRAIRANASYYSVMDGMGRGSHDAGSAYVSQWYARNCYIFSNVLSVLAPGDRAIVIIGQGHAYLLREFVRLNPHVVDVSPVTYLR